MKQSNTVRWSLFVIILLGFIMMFSPFISKGAYKQEIVYFKNDTLILTTQSIDFKADYIKGFYDKTNDDLYFNTTPTSYILYDPCTKTRYTVLSKGKQHIGEHLLYLITNIRKSRKA